MTEQFDRFLIWIPDHFAVLARIVLILILASIALRAIHRLLPRLREVIAARQSSMEDSQRVRTLSRVVRYALTVATAVVTALLILGELGVSVAPILGAAGVAGIAIGFGAQSLVKDYFTGFFLLLENQIRHGDVVEAGGKAGVDQWADSALVIRCRFRVAPLQQWNVRREYLQKLKEAFDREGIEIPYPHLKIVQSPSE